MSIVPPSLETARRARTTILRDGSAVRLRALQAGDDAALLQFLGRVSADSLYLRFFGTCSLDRAAASLADCSRPDDVALVAEAGGDGSLVAHAGAFRVGPDRAEVAFLVADQWQGRGLGSILLCRLLDAARERGVRTLVADVLPGNHSMLAVFQRCGYPVRIRSDPQWIRVLIGTRASSEELLAA
jgi:RimJ/RimL family protein N-acetyltransferase